MNVITITSEAFEELQSRLDSIHETILRSERKTLLDNWIPKKEAHKLYFSNICLKTFNSWLKSGKLPFSQYGSKVYLKEEDIQNFFSHNYITKTNNYESR